MSFEKRIRNLDIFKKVPSDLSQATNLGGALSILTVLLILFFSYVEFKNYLNPSYSAEITQDKLFTREEMKYPFLTQHQHRHRIPLLPLRAHQSRPGRRHDLPPSQHRISREVEAP
jgi:hypothetical protein